MTIGKSNKSGQEEMVGFALIMVIVAVILLIFVWFSLKGPQKETVESYEVESFIQALLHYTTDCVDGYEPVYYDVRELINSCERGGDLCLDGRNTCEVLNSTMEGIIHESWPVGEDYPVKGYEMKILSGGEELLLIHEGNETGNSKGAMEPLSRIDIYFTAYY